MCEHENYSLNKLKMSSELSRESESKLSTYQKTGLNIHTENPNQGVSKISQVSIENTTNKGTRMSDFEELENPPINAVPDKYKYTNFSQTSSGDGGGQIWLNQEPEKMVKKDDH